MRSEPAPGSRPLTARHRYLEVSFAERWRRWWTPTGMRHLTDPTVLSASVPPDAEYVTVGTVRTLPDARAFLGATPGERRLQYQRRLVPQLPDSPPTAGLLVLAGSRLAVRNAEVEIWAADLREITDIDAHQHTGFVLLTSRADGLLIGQQLRVPPPVGARWRTAGRVTNAFGGWDALLRAHGVRVHF